MVLHGAHEMAWHRTINIFFFRGGQNSKASQHRACTAHVMARDGVGCTKRGVLFLGEGLLVRATPGCTVWLVVVLKNLSRQKICVAFEGVGWGEEGEGSVRLGWGRP